MTDNYESPRAQYAYEGEEDALLELDTEADPLAWTNGRHACTGAGSGARCVCGAHRLDPIHYGAETVRRRVA